MSEAIVVQTGGAPVEAPPKAGALSRRESDEDRVLIREMFRAAIDKGPDGVEALEKLVALNDQMQRRRAELEFVIALAEFQNEVPLIAKTREAKIVTGKGGGFTYNYADFEQIVTTIRPTATKHGFSWTFDSTLEGDRLSCTCVLHHANGHSTKSSFTLPVTNPNAMSPQQKVGSALTFAKRQTLVSAFGLTLTDPDPEEVVHEPIGGEKATELRALAAEVHANVDTLLRIFGVTKFEDMKLSQYGEAIRMLESKRKK